MAAGTLPAPGTELGPCHNTTCKHRDCACTRAMAQARCSECDKVISYDRKFYQVEASPKRQAEPGAWDGVLVHATCLEDRVERERRERDAKGGAS